MGCTKDDLGKLTGNFREKELGNGEFGEVILKSGTTYC